MSTVVKHLNSGSILEIVKDDLHGSGYGTVTLLDIETNEEYVIGGYEFEMEYEYLGDRP